MNSLSYLYGVMIQYDFFVISIEIMLDVKLIRHNYVIRVNIYIYIQMKFQHNSINKLKKNYISIFLMIFIIFNYLKVSSRLCLVGLI